MGAEQHRQFIMDSLNVYDKILHNIVAFIGNNCAVNQLLSSLACKLLASCVAQKLSLAVDA